ncbi:tRNA N(3)-methylcytidine methyltransferase METTL6 [Athalia rosae]|uniref:tRNA N(3)-methylcytidine methyltransferase METTL6 n=1 Tax=Athalia rosae TaxID=37344 RepID=UPI002033A796|nr:tRNA N(3)-methylcytidine methyltransferase METTL6 [Athalia rosae]XP_020710866.2 tRNA N(3)-methylcytidine methyltransferase METTL6 [Athalia rosae]XP_048504842.1 tRNA N(3)-methylcytidine methyltransferase METTL6 [Athalia rosae]
MEAGVRSESHVAKELTEDEINRIREQNSRLVPEHRALQLEKEAKKHWDLFYKRNETRFFKDRHWTTREFEELLDLGGVNNGTLLEVGCGVGNLFYPLLEDGLKIEKIYACDLSPRAIDFVKNHELFDSEKIMAFQADVTAPDCFSIVNHPIDVATMIFVLSAIHPDKFRGVAERLFAVMSSGGTILFRDYGLYDMAQLRFKPGHKISENFYVRQDGTRSYYFSIEEVRDIFVSAGFQELTCSYVQRRTINVKEKIDVPRIFVQAKFKKP